MGIVNLTPDSFYDGGAHNEPDAALRHALLLLEQGADILDLGAESTRPGAEEISDREEQARLLPVLRALKAHRPPGGRTRLSVDTYRASTALAALEAGADIINDISAARFDLALPEVLAQYGPGYVLMHCRGRPADMQRAPRYKNVVDEVLLFFERSLKRLCGAGLAEENIVLDPGIGFGKRLEDNLALLRGFPRLAEFGRPLLAGLSMKSFFGELLGLAPERRGPATQTASALLLAAGAKVHRVHDVAAAMQALRLAQALTPGNA
jgi:dihydropteroate synthase